MLWKHYVFKRNYEALDIWDRLFEGRSMRILYITGRGFDIRAKTVMEKWLNCINASKHKIEKAELLLVNFTEYNLSEDLKNQTSTNAGHLKEIFDEIGSIQEVDIRTSVSDEEDVSTSNALKYGLQTVLSKITDHTDVILDVSSLPRVVYLTLMTGILDKLIPNKASPEALWKSGVNFQVIVAEDAVLDSKIRSEDPSNDLVSIPGFSVALQAESVQDWPLVWFPILGENRIGQLEKTMKMGIIPEAAEICPVLPNPSRDPRRADKLLVEYQRPLFDIWQTPMTNILYVHERHPFEAYRQLLKSMNHYKDSLGIIEGCRLFVTPLASKLITIGAGLACFEIKPIDIDANYGVSIPYVEPTRYDVTIDDLQTTIPELSMLLLTGDAYNPTP